MPLDIVLNGQRVSVDAEPDELLLWVLRDKLDLTGAKYGCGEGQCGACTVLLDGVAVHACTTTLSAVRGRPITTIEGLARGEKLHPVQEAFLQVEAFQCGFCTPGMVLGAASLLRRKAHPTVAEIKTGLNGHICRCGTYPRIVEAVRLAAEASRGRA